MGQRAYGKTCADVFFGGILTSDSWAAASSGLPASTVVLPPVALERVQGRLRGCGGAGASLYRGKAESLETAQMEKSGLRGDLTSADS